MSKAESGWREVERNVGIMFSNLTDSISKEVATYMDSCCSVNVACFRMFPRAHESRIASNVAMKQFGNQGKRIMMESTLLNATDNWNSTSTFQTYEYFMIEYMTRRLLVLVEKF